MNSSPIIVATCIHCGDLIFREDVQIKTRLGLVHGRCVAGPWPGRVCRGCGCTDDAACSTDAGPCWWIEAAPHPALPASGEGNGRAQGRADLCSACAPTAGEREREMPHAASDPVPRKRTARRQRCAS